MPPHKTRRESCIGLIIDDQAGGGSTRSSAPSTPQWPWPPVSPADVEDNPQVAFGHVIDGLLVGTCRSGTTDQHQADGQERDAGEHDDGVGRRAEPGDRL